MKGTSKNMDPAAEGNRLFAVLCPLLIVAAGACVYSTSFDGAFMFDEIGRIVNNEQIRGFWPPSRLLPGRRPVVTFSLALNYAISGLEVWSYHAFNLCVHLLAGLTLFGIVRRILLHIPSEVDGPGGAPGSAPPRGATPRKAGRKVKSKVPPHRSTPDRRSYWMALTVALLWVVHPLQTQSVTYIIQRGESLMGLFYLLTVYCVIRSDRSPSPYRWYAAAVVACTLGMGSKAVMVTAPLVVLLFDAVFIGRSFRRAVSSRWPVYAGLAATWLVLVLLGIVRGVLSPTNRSATVGLGFQEVSPLQYALTQSEVILHYLRISLWPAGLCLDYSWPVVENMSQAIVPSVIVVALLALTVWGLFAHPRLGFLGAWFFIILAPTSSFIPIKDLAFEHRMYLPLAGVLALVVVAAREVVHGLVMRTGAAERTARTVSAGLVVAAVCALGYTTLQRNRDYHTRLAMWRDVTTTRPGNARGHCNLGVALLEDGQIPEAIEACREAVHIDPDFASGHYRLAKALKKAGEWDQAISSFQRAIELDPGYADARFDLGNTFFELGRTEESIAEYTALVRINPAYTKGRINLGNALGKVGRVDEAVSRYREAIRMEPTSIEARYNLAVTLLKQSQVDQAVAELRELLRISPGFAPGHVSLGNVFLRRGEAQSAVEAFQRALQLNRQDPGTHFNLGIALQRLDRLEEAARHFEIVLELRPGNPDAQQALEITRREIQQRRTNPP